MYDVSVKYVVARRVGGHEEYLRRDGSFGPFDFVDSLRRSPTRSFHSEDAARSYIEGKAASYPSSAPREPLAVSKIP